MFARTHSHPELEELLKWAILLVLASALALLIVSSATGADLTIKDVPAPGAPPPGVKSLDQPLVELTEDPFELSALIWQALDQQRQGNLDEALGLWESFRLPGPRDVWRRVAISLILLQTERNEQAAEQLVQADAIAPENPLVAYCLGILRLAQAERAEQWYDAIGTIPIHLVAATPLDVAPNTRSMYELAAMVALERAIRGADRLDPRQSLVPDEWVLPDDYERPLSMRGPAIQDLLEATGLATFEGKANVVLADMHRVRGSLLHAEEHLDRATELGMRTGPALRELGRSYEAQRQYGHAARAHLKSIAHGAGVAAPAQSALENLRRALFDIF